MSECHFEATKPCGGLKSLMSCHNILSNGHLWLTHEWKMSGRVYAIERKNLDFLQKCSNFLHHCASRNVGFIFISEAIIRLSRVMGRPTERRARIFAEQFFLVLLPILCDFHPFYVTIIFRCVWCLVRFPWISRCVVLNVGCKLWAKNSLESTSSWNFSLAFNDPKNSFEWKWTFSMLSQASSMTEGGVWIWRSKAVDMPSWTLCKSLETSFM